MTEFSQERLDHLKGMVHDIIIDMDDLHICYLMDGEDGYHKRVDTIAHMILYSLIGEMALAKEI